MAANSRDETKPTILAFHGSGSNGLIHTVQLARLSRHLKDQFNIEQVEAPFPSAAGPGVLPMFEGCGPYKRWIPPSEAVSISGMKSGEGSSAMPLQVESLIRDTVTRVAASGGKVAGLIAFSQGTRVLAGLLKGAEIRRALGAPHDELAWLDFAFAISVCGSYPPPLVPQCAATALEKSGLGAAEQKAVLEGRIAVPTVHVQGLKDEWHWAGQLLIATCYEVGEEKSRVLEFEHDHVYPSVEDSKVVAEWVGQTWKEKGKR
ncbi:serine hydrolase FSH [Massariosphaeria phaeospora]|uniref:Serine hydrolase FSH n=1 Tax=Massariosphaeria phaeospora TaxID=100035 RepID=A0A7C8MDD9_9PLEO|nr:serine hydrolase FSH [Massariosphaeria phaeospora]